MLREFAEDMVVQFPSGRESSAHTFLSLEVIRKYIKEYGVGSDIKHQHVRIIEWLVLKMRKDSI